MNTEFIINEAVPFFKLHPMLSIAWIGLFIVVIYLTIKSRFSRINAIANSQAISLVNNEKAITVDLRSADSFKKGHITDSINVLPSDIKNSNVKSIEKYKESPIILVDENGMTANASGELLVKLGFNHIFVLKDGIAGWNSENLPLVRK